MNQTSFRRLGISTEKHSQLFKFPISQQDIRDHNVLSSINLPLPLASNISPPLSTNRQYSSQLDSDDHPELLSCKFLCWNGQKDPWHLSWQNLDRRWGCGKYGEGRGLCLDHWNAWLVNTCALHKHRGVGVALMMSITVVELFDILVCAAERALEQEIGRLDCSPS
jgi:hypothetical protein